MSPRNLSIIVLVVALLPLASALPAGTLDEGADLNIGLVHAAVDNARGQLSSGESANEGSAPVPGSAPAGPRVTPETPSAIPPAPVVAPETRADTSNPLTSDALPPVSQMFGRSGGRSSGEATNEDREESSLLDLAPALPNAVSLVSHLTQDILRVVDDLEVPTFVPTTDATPMDDTPITTAGTAAVVRGPADTPASTASVIPPVAALVAVAALAAPPSAWWTALRRFAPFAALYTRIAKEQLLEHDRREALVNAIRAQPGQAVTDLVKTTNVPRNTAVYHLMRLEREGLVASRREGRTRLYFAPGSLEKRADSEALAAVRHGTTRAMALEVGAEPGLDQNALCKRFNLTPSLAHWHAKRLVDSGILQKVREGRRVRYYPGDSFDVVRAA